MQQFQTCWCGHYRRTMETRRNLVFFLPHFVLYSFLCLFFFCCCSFRFLHFLFYSFYFFSSSTISHISMLVDTVSSLSDSFNNLFELSLLLSSLVFQNLHLYLLLQYLFIYLSCFVPIPLKLLLPLGKTTLQNGNFLYKGSWFVLDLVI